MIARTLRNLKHVFKTSFDIKNLLSAQEAVNDEVDRAVDDEEEVLDGSEAEHPDGACGEYAQAHADDGPLNYAGQYIIHYSYRVSSRK